ncbi:MAG: protein kinase [Candidatus Latescibacteria bacterium]|nr:protein kinase [Candidatus Latescibacterota bacterium]
MICPECNQETPDFQDTCIHCGADIFASEWVSDEEKQLVKTLAGRYDVIRKLGSGGMARVYLAREIDLDRNVAIKVLPREYLRDREFVARFKREAQIAANLEHPNIVRIYQISQDKELCYFVMSYIPGGTLSEKMQEQGILSTDDIILWGTDVCSGLQYAHEHDVIHRDLKPDNIMIDQYNRAIVMDFGIARAAQSSVLTQKDTIIGSPQYLSPEMAKGVEIDTRSDIYSMGVVLYQMATATLPFLALDPPSLMYMHVHEIPDPPDVRNTAVPSWLCDVILKCLEKKPDNRYFSFEELRLALTGHKTSGVIAETQKEKNRRNKRKEQVIDVLGRIPIFRGLSLPQLKKILGICSKRTLYKDEILCYIDEESFNIFILIKGMLRITFREGKELSRIIPLGIVGEMGVFTGEKRSAMVIAANECVVLDILKSDLFEVLHNDSDMGIIVLKNVIDDLAKKLRINNVIIEKLEQVCDIEDYSAIISQVLPDSQS